MTADARPDDIVLPYNILRALHERVALSVMADVEAVAEGCEEAFTDAAPTVPGACGARHRHRPLRGGRTPGRPRRARAMDAGYGLRFGGLTTDPPAGAPERAAAGLGRAIGRRKAASLPPERTSGGGMPNVQRTGGGDGGDRAPPLSGSVHRDATSDPRAAAGRGLWLVRPRVRLPLR